MWEIVGVFLALGGAALASLRSRARRTGYYEGQVYEMTAASHRRFTILSLGFAGIFALLAALPVVPVFPVLAAYVVFLILYIASFARGATGEDE